MIWHNPLAEMYGPTFLVFYAFVIAVVIGFCLWKIRVLDTSAASMQPLLAPSNPDIYQIAYLRGGRNEVIRVAIYKLLKLGCLIQLPKAGNILRSKAAELVVSHDAALSADLSEIDSVIMSYFSTRHTTAELFRSSTPAAIEQCCSKYEAWQGRELLVTPSTWLIQARAISLAGICAIFALGAYKLLAALNNGHNNVGFLVLFFLVGATLLAVAGRLPKMTCRGRYYLDRLKSAYGHWRPDIALDSKILSVAIIGMAALNGTGDRSYRSLFYQTSSGNCGGGGGGNSYWSGGSGGAGCGGGGGGGGGCGGCGGGT